MCCYLGDCGLKRTRNIASITFVYQKWQSSEKEVDETIIIIPAIVRKENRGKMYSSLKINIEQTILNLS